jgi:hypothetical protein
MIDKSKIIDAIKKTDDEFVLTAINEILQEGSNIPDWHIEVLKQRIKDMEEGNAVFHNWDDVRNSIFATK